MQNYNSMNNCCCSCGIKQAICILKDIKDLIKKQTVYFNCGTSYGEIKDSKYPNFVLIEETSETSNKMKILKDIKDLIKKQTVYFNCGTSYGEIKDSKYPNFVLIEETSETSNKMKVNLCIDDINFIKIEPKYGECQSIINELNKYYISPVVVEGKCDENCCCKSDINFIKIEPKYGECQSIINELNKYYISPVVVEGKCDENCCCKSSVAAYMKDKYIKPRSDKRKFKITFRNINYSVPNIENHFVTIIHLDYDVAWAIDVIDKSLYLISLCQVCALID